MVPRRLTQSDATCDLRKRSGVEEEPIASAGEEKRKALD